MKQKWNQLVGDLMQAGASIKSNIAIDKKQKQRFISASHVFIMC